jgi:uncharacterized membrane protein
MKESLKRNYNLKINCIFLLLCIAGICLRLLKLGEESLWLDEAFTWYYSKKLSVAELFVNRIKAGHFPFYFIFMKHWINLFGDTELSLRFPSFVFGILSLAVFYLLLKHSLNSKFVRIWAFLMFALSTFSIEIAQEARMYSILLFTFLLTIYFLVQLVEKRKFLVPYLLSLTLFLCIGSPALLPYLGILLYLGMKVRKEPFYKNLLLLSILPILPLLPLFILIAGLSQFSIIERSYVLYRFSLSRHIALFFGWLFRSLVELSNLSYINFHVYNLPFALYVILALSLVPILILGAKKLTFELKHLTFLFYLTFLIFFFCYKFESRYIFYLFPFASISWGAFLDHLKGNYRKAISGLLLIAYLISLHDYYAVDKSKWKEVAHYIYTNEKPGEEIWIFPRFCYPVFEYYYKGSNKIVKIQPELRLPHVPNRNIWYIVWLNVKLIWVGGPKAFEIDNYIKTNLSSILIFKKVKYFKGRKSIIEVNFYGTE